MVLEVSLMQKSEAQMLCRNHLHRYVRIHTADGRIVDGIIENVDDDHVYLAVPIGPGEVDMRFYNPFYPPYYSPGYFYPPYPRRRFRRVVLPLAALIGLSLLPYY
jgi:hypothetical protein